MSGKDIDNMLDSLFGADRADSASEQRLRSLEGDLGVPGGPAPRRAQRPETTEPGIQLNVDAGRRREPVSHPVQEADQGPTRIGAAPAPSTPPPAPAPSRPAPRTVARPAELPKRPRDTREPARPRGTREPVRPRDTREPVRPRDTREPVRQRTTQPPPVAPVPRVSTPPARARRTTGSHRRVTSAPRSSRATAGHRALSEAPRRARTTSSHEPRRASRAPIAPALVNTDDLFAQFDDLDLETAQPLAPSSALGDLDRIARLLIDMHSINWSSLDPRAGFLITQVDGATSFNDLMILTGLPQADATALVEHLINEGILG
jgi:hypothetical protein